MRSGGGRRLLSQFTNRSACQIIIVVLMLANMVNGDSSVKRTVVLGFTALGDGCPLSSTLAASAECVAATAVSGTLTGCAACDASEVLPLTTTTDVSADVRGACSGTFHSLMLLGNGTVVGYGPLRLLGVGNDTEHLVGCSTRSDVGATVVVAGGAQDVHCAGNLSLVVLQNGTTLVFGQASSTSIVGSNTTMVLSATSLEGLLGLSDNALGAVAAGVGLDALVVLLSNGSLITTGTGSLRGVPSSTEPTSQWSRSIDSVCPEGAGLAKNLSVGAQHVLVICANGTVVGFGDNSFGQLSSNTSAFTIESPQMLVLSSSTMSIVQAAAGYSHSILLSSAVVDGQRQLLGAGDNSNGALGFDGAGASLAGFQALPTTTSGSLPLPGVISFVAAGRQYSAILVQHDATSTTRRYRSNLYAAGSNVQCAMGSSVSASGASQKTWTVVRLHRSAPYYATAISLSFSRRTIVSGYESPTVSSSGSLPTASPSWQATRGSRSLSVRRSATLEPTHTLRSSSPSASSALTLTVTTSKTRTLSATMEPGPTIVAVYWAAERRTLVVVFDAATNTPTTSVQLLLQVSGTRQSFGESSLSDGVWVTPRELWVTFSLHSTANITVSVANIAIRADVVALRRQGGFSLASIGGVTVAVVPSGAPSSAQLVFGSTNAVTRVAIGVGVGILMAIVLGVVVAYVFWARRSRRSCSDKRGHSTASPPPRRPAATLFQNSEPLPLPSHHPLRAVRPQLDHGRWNEPTAAGGGAPAMFGGRPSPEHHRQRYFLSPPTAPGPPLSYDEAEDGRAWTLSP